MQTRRCICKNRYFSNADAKVATFFELANITASFFVKSLKYPKNSLIPIYNKRNHPPNATPRTATALKSEYRRTRFGEQKRLREPIVSSRSAPDSRISSAASQQYIFIYKGNRRPRSAIFVPVDAEHLRTRCKKKSRHPCNRPATNYGQQTSAAKRSAQNLPPRTNRRHLFAHIPHAIPCRPQSHTAPETPTQIPSATPPLARHRIRTCPIPPTRQPTLRLQTNEAAAPPRSAAA